MVLFLQTALWNSPNQIIFVMKITIVNLEGYTHVGYKAENNEETRTLKNLWTVMKLEGLDVNISLDGKEMKGKFEEKVKLPGFDLYYSPKNFDVLVGTGIEEGEIIRTLTHKNMKGEKEADKIQKALWEGGNCGANNIGIQLHTRLKDGEEVPFY